MKKLLFKEVIELSEEKIDLYKEEEKKLSEKLAKIQEYYERLENIPRYYGNDFTEQVLEDNRERQREQLKKSLEEPYFGRLDFQEDGSKGAVETYIGKVGVQEEKTGKLLVIDWRAPVSTLFYAFSGSEDYVFYQSPDGIVDGTIHLKRNIVIRQKNLIRVVDSYVKGEELNGGDEFLLYKLGEQKDNKLKDIVSTIQAEQNAIIRHPNDKALIIQGVAGSGKTTVALHRLAYLLYEYREQMQPERMIIFAPNSMFLDYISHVLPELGVGHIKQTTFSDWAIISIGERITLTDQQESLKKRFEEKSENVRKLDQIAGFKGSLAFRDQIDEMLKEFEASCLPKKDFSPWEGAVYEKEKLIEWLKTDGKHSPLAIKRSRMQARLKRWIEIELKMFGGRERQEVKKKAMQRLRSFMNDWPKASARSLYGRVLKKQFRHEESSFHKLQKGQVEQEDLAPLLYITHYLNGIDKEGRFDHVVIDEAQDFSPFQLAVIKARTRKHSFTILGDLAQGIYGNQGIEEWQRFKEVLGEDNTALFQIEKSYRSTMEIIEFANSILMHLEPRPAVALPVFRSGEQVRTQKTEALEQHKEIVKWTQEMAENQVQTMSIIGRTEEQCEKIYENLTKNGIEATFIRAKDRSYQGGISVLPIYLSKGLEFDAVLLAGVTQEHYPKDSFHTKLLYVGCTRALHYLHLFYEERPSLLIANKV